AWHVVVALVARESEPTQRVALRFAGMTDRDAFRAVLVAAACLLNAAVDPQAELARDRVVREAEQLMAGRHRHPPRVRAIALAQDGAVKTGRRINPGDLLVLVLPRAVPLRVTLANTEQLQRLDTGVRDRIGGGLGSGHERAAAGILFGHFVCFLGHEKSREACSACG